MKKAFQALVLLVALPATSALADDQSIRAAVGGGLAGAVGGYLGSELGGRSGAILGSGLGAALGSAVATDGYEDRRYYRDRKYRYKDRERRYRRDRDDDWDD
ncbi:MAG: hypothetical protein GVY09_17000 [Gammaproteobacteria bacterium]|jgi:hypothetical protein|nr:hypothetical protein [Gammaproteobacteria bacterium]